MNSSKDGMFRQKDELTFGSSEKQRENYKTKSDSHRPNLIGDISRWHEDRVMKINDHRMETDNFTRHTEVSEQPPENPTHKNLLSLINNIDETLGICTELHHEDHNHQNRMDLQRGPVNFENQDLK